MTASLLLSLFAMAFLGYGSSKSGIEPSSRSFERGIATRSNAVVARAQFAEAARRYDEYWASGTRSPDIALIRGRAHHLAGNLPQAIRAFRDGLELYPWSAELQRDLTISRRAVAYPVEADPAERVRPDPPASLRHRVSHGDLFGAAALASLLVAVGLARRLTAGEGWAVPVAGVGLVGLLAVVAAAAVIERQRALELEKPVVVLTEEAVLRTGNGPTFAPRLDATLPRGAEVRELARRGGWVQVELPGGAVGWVPAGAVLEGGPAEPGQP